ncbi:hypothetical protein WJX81_003530 [Elliptochloris bilobata]|uniref:Methylenetetrahydrofolate reductase (NAD(P)H) n=1 Tax=Elliptochloris bilobata TaxID=381761 RepID=A0AAW1QJG2_9CHLO
MAPWGSSAAAQPAQPEAGRATGGWVVTTVAAQLRSRQALEARLLQRAERGPSGERADALLLVSGSHPLRDVLAPAGLLPDALHSLRAAAAMRTAGQLPLSLSLWAVANPLTEGAPFAAAKVDNGAEVIVTQPPLVWPLFEAWLDEMNTRGLTRGAEGNGCGPAFCQQYTADLIAKVLALPGVAGLHLMPVTKRGRAMAQLLTRDGAFCVSQPHGAQKADSLRDDRSREAHEQLDIA